jgi:hypothetical protein
LTNRTDGVSFAARQGGVRGGETSPLFTAEGHDPNDPRDRKFTLTHLRWEYLELIKRLNQLVTPWLEELDEEKLQGLDLILREATRMCIRECESLLVAQEAPAGHGDQLNLLEDGSDDDAGRLAGQQASHLDRE